MNQKRPFTILTIDDDASARAFILAVLSQEGFRVLEAENGTEGIRTAKSERPDLILLDVAMPGMDGWEVARELRAEKRTCEIPILMLSGLALGEQDTAVSDGVADFYLTKPVPPRRLIEHVLAFLKKAASAGSGKELSATGVGPTSTRLYKVLRRHTLLSEEAILDKLSAPSEEAPAILQDILNRSELTEEQKGKCVADYWDLPFLDIRVSRVSPEAAQLFDVDYQKSNHVILLRIEQDVLHVGVTDPLRLAILDEIRLITGFDVRPVIVTESALKAAYVELEAIQQKQYADSASRKKPSSLAGEVIPEGPLVEEQDLYQESQLTTGDDVYNLDKESDDVPVIQLVNSILARGIQLGVSDIHFQSERNCLRVRYRVDGVLQDGPEVPPSLMRIVVARLKAMAGMDLAARLVPQDGRLTVESEGRRFEIRVSIVQSVEGPKAVLRLAEQHDEVMGLERLGFSPVVLDQFRTLIHRPHGLILVTGPTGSGKSTTLYGALAELNQPELSIFTVENPVETRIAGLTQLEIRERAGLSFAASLRAALRQDPDILMVGEIRDEETASIATQASLTGHLVLSTLHTNDAASAITRLIDMGIQPFLVGSTLLGVLAQRLARLLCTSCSRPVTLSRDELAELAISLPADQTIQARAPAGCPACNNSGYKGRIGIYEFLFISEPIQRFILERHPDAEIRRKAVEEGMQTLLDDALARFSAGETSLEELHRVVFF